MQRRANRAQQLRLGDRDETIVADRGDQPFDQQLLAQRLQRIQRRQHIVERGQRVRRWRVRRAQARKHPGQSGDVGALRRYSVGGNLTWISWPDALSLLDSHLTAFGCAGLVLRGQSPAPLIGAYQQSPFLARIRRALDPNQHFLDFA